MAWGMHEPSRFGEFFPDGDYVGREEALREYYNQMSEEEKKLRGMVKRFSLTGFSKKYTRDFGPMTDAECPNEFLTVKSYRSLGSLLNTSNRLLAVDQGFKDILEELEPGVHQFWPIEIRMPRNKTYPSTYYGLRIGQFLDAFNPDHSKDECYNISGYENYRGVAPIKKAITGLAVSKDAVVNAHLWREKKLTQPDIFLSNELQQRAREAGLRLPKHFQMKEV
ncbi:imm11 family protein [Cognatiyoonia sp. IB215182]|uniref:imm11 family protein n=1 Tax=Cognatiyoonia sp. IB215182 TaxID=3097353 RepID=UPI002A14B5F7|nr:DUF1629 domain-containing protein [Cognatiyoonia sp. IB215182]MDX8350915.1 hypothetical protein [Cognatiyoonia sp. IB215182]